MSGALRVVSISILIVMMRRNILSGIVVLIVVCSVWGLSVAIDMFLVSDLERMLSIVEVVEGV